MLLKVRDERGGGCVSVNHVAIVCRLTDNQTWMCIHTFITCLIGGLLINPTTDIHHTPIVWLKPTAHRFFIHETISKQMDHGEAYTK